MQPPPPPPPPGHEPRNGQNTDMERGNVPGRSKVAPSPSFLLFMTMVNSLTHVLLGAVAFSVFIIGFINENSSFALHIYFCVTGYVLLMGMGVLSMCPHAGWARHLRRKYRRFVHMCLQGLGTVFVVSGCIIKMVDSNPNLSSAHSIVGLVAMIFTILNAMAGIFNYCFNMSKISQLLHFVCGCISLILAFVALIIAFDYYYRIFFNDSSTNVIICMAVFALLGVLTSAGINKVKKLPSKP